MLELTQEDVMCGMIERQRAYELYTLYDLSTANGAWELENPLRYLRRLLNRTFRNRGWAPQGSSGGASSYSLE